MHSTNPEEYYIQQISTTCLAHFAYYIESNKEAVIIDPLRDPESYLAILEQRGAKLKYILETHFHADFVSGHLDLNKLTGAQIVFGPTAQPEFEALVAEDGQLLPLGNIKIKVVHTPGHTVESSCFVLLDSEETPKAVFTGDTIFLGDIGRPDLAVSHEVTDRDLAGLLYDSIQKVKTLPDDVVLYPGHGAGSACGKKISTGLSCTVGIQKKNNYALNDNLTKEEFIEIVTSDLPTPPQYFFMDAMMNKRGYEAIEPIVQKSLVPFSPEQFFKFFSEDKDYAFIDTRDFLQSIRGFLRGTYVISLKIQFAIWTATFFPPEKKIILITEVGKERESITRLARVGYENVVGYADGGYDALFAYAQEHSLQDKFASLTVVDLTQIKEVVEENATQKNYDLLDVREKAEITSALPNANFFPLSGLEKRIEEVKKTFEGKKIGIYCKTGGRASLASSILTKHGISDITFLGGILNMIEKEVKLTPIENK